MVKAVRGTYIIPTSLPHSLISTSFLLTKPPPGVLVECEPAIKSILVHIDSMHNHEFIIEDLDETHLFIKEAMLGPLKAKLEEVCFSLFLSYFPSLFFIMG